MYPKDVVEWIRDANDGEKDQGPLKDAPGALPVEVAPRSTPSRRRPPMRARPAASTKKPAAPNKKRLANKPEESKVSSAIH